MKRSIALIFAGGLTAIVALVFSVSALSAVEPSTQLVPHNPLPPVELEVNDQFNPPEATAVDTAATAEMLYRQTEKSIQEQETFLKTEVSRRQQAITELDGSAQSQITQLNAQITGLQGQIDQKTANIQAVQENIAALQQAIQQDNAVYQSELAKMIDAENQLRQQVEVASSQLNVVYQQLTQRQALAQQAAIQAAAAQSGGGGGSGYRDHDDDHGGHDDDDHRDHEDDHDDDD